MSELFETPKVGQRVSKNCVIGAPVTTIEKVMELAANHKSLYSPIGGVKPAAAFAGMPFKRVIDALQKGQVFETIISKPARKPRAVRKKVAEKVVEASQADGDESTKKAIDSILDDSSEPAPKTQEEFIEELSKEDTQKLEDDFSISSEDLLNETFPSEP